MKFNISFLIILLFVLTACGGETTSITSINENTQLISNDTLESNLSEARTTSITSVNENIQSIWNDTLESNASNDTTQNNESNLSDTLQEESRFNFYNAKPLPAELIDNLHVGFGGRNAYPFAREEGDQATWVTSVELMMNENLAHEERLQKIKNFEGLKFTELQKYLVKSKYISYWIPQGWDESWYSPTRIQEAMDAGYVPVFIYYYFGDRLNSVPSGEDLESYYKDNQRVSQFMQKLKGTKLFVMEAEFNKDEIIKNEMTLKAFGDIITQGIDTIEQNVSDIYFSLCMTDKAIRGSNVTLASCGYENCALGDQYSWSKTDYIFHYLKDKISFISFQEMIAQFSRDPDFPGAWGRPNPRAFDEIDSGIYHLDERIVNLSRFLYNRFKKPVFIPYMTIPTATWTDHDSSGTIDRDELDEEGWVYTAERVYRGLKSRQESLKESGLFGYMPISLFDDPRQDFGGYQYFINNEYHFGLIQTGAEDEVDKYIHGDLEFKGNLLEEVFGVVQ